MIQELTEDEKEDMMISTVKILNAVNMVFVAGVPRTETPKSFRT